MLRPKLKPRALADAYAEKAAGKVQSGVGHAKDAARDILKR